MMRLQSVVLANARAPQNPNRVPFREEVSLKLRNKVGGKNETLSTGICLHEMSLIFACFKQNNFKEEFCHKEILNFQKCFDATKGEVLREKSASVHAVNNLLQRYPNV